MGREPEQNYTIERSPFLKKKNFDNDVEKYADKEFSKKIRLVKEGINRAIQGGDFSGKDL